jgi:hypothetical protein
MENTPETQAQIEKLSRARERGFILGARAAGHSDAKIAGAVVRYRVQKAKQIANMSKAAEAIIG